MRHLRNSGLIVLYMLVLSATIVYSLQSRVEPVEMLESDKVTLTFRHLWTKEHDRPILNIFQDVIRQFEQDNPNVKINFEGLDQTVHREQKLKSEMVTGTPPDMFVLFGGAEFEPYARSDRLMDLTDFVEQHGLEFRQLKMWTFNDRIYGLPFEGHAEPVFYNRSIFDELGLKPPETLSELEVVNEVLRENGYIPFALGNKELWPGAIYAHYLMDRYAGPLLIEELVRGGSESKFFNPAYVRAFDTLKKWAEQGDFNEHADQVTTEEAIELFVNRKAAMYLNGTWDINMLRSSDGSTQFQDEVGVMHFPKLSEDGPQSIAGGYTIGIALSSNLNEAQAEAALKLLEAIYTEEVQARIVYEGQRLPSMEIPIDPTRTGPIFAQVYEMMGNTKHTFVAYDNVLSPEVKKTFLSVVNDLLEARTTTPEALRQLDEASAAYWKLREQ